ncbi:MAG: hypothetical protein KKG09_04825 [Verrucomicrobia bacterium]|nr:hypothetical protein [Verrucomicrobiota bacterium]MCG2679200.1 hypothetical protein [Kiritimatiellia bacterium]MBU4248135.1 hypothetical protein [Verrucomicrobiota bacterium]MBU4289512.1 hypothetical protein [Verrucomicrobiota bacterium]MBU4429877.1 hypothetical protein [Verrucomicrobiota bacterium]
MKSYQALKQAINNKGIKTIAAEMGISAPLVYKWCEPKSETDVSGTDNPLDRIAQIVELTGEIGPIAWLCRKANGFFVANPSKSRMTQPTYIKETRRMLKEFSDVIEAISAGIEDDGSIDFNECNRIREEWDGLKTIIESFVIACERGMFATHK